MYTLDNILLRVKKKNPHQKEFHQAVEKLIKDVLPFINDNNYYEEESIIERLLEPERVIMFKVLWRDDQNKININRGFRIQYSSALGPYKGGLRFHPSVNLSILKFLAFKQVFKNALTGLPLGGGKGGADFDPRGKSDREIMNFCIAFMTELHRHIGPETDVPAGDIGVGSKEIGYLYGQYKKINNIHTGVLTGKGVGWGGSDCRIESTGYGLIYFLQNILQEEEDVLDNKKILISGSGNVALHAAEKAIMLGAKVMTLSDSSGYIYDKNGIDKEKLKFVKNLKLKQKGRIKEYLDQYPQAEYHDSKKPWEKEADIALPCATQNEIEKSDAETLISHGIRMVAEGANMPCTSDAIDLFHENDVIFAPGNAANAGGVSVSGLEMTQNAIHSRWDQKKVDNQLQKIISQIYTKCKKYGEENGKINYAKGANIAAFISVTDAMIDQGVI